MEELDVAVEDDLSCKESKSPTSIDVCAENNQLSQVNALPHGEDDSDMLKTSRIDNFHVEDIGVVQENPEISRKETPKPPNLLCNTSNEKDKGENEIT